MFVFLHGYDTIREAFVKNADVFSNRPSWLKGLKEAIKEGKGVGWQSGNDWKVLRKFVLQTLRDFGVGKTSLEQKILREVDAANDVLYATNGKPSDVRLLTSMMINNVIYGIVFAKRFDYEDDKLQEIIENMGRIFRGGASFTPEGMMPTFLLKLFNKEKCGDKVVTWADRGSLPYTEATLLKIQRMANICELVCDVLTKVNSGSLVMGIFAYFLLFIQFTLLITGFVSDLHGTPFSVPHTNEVDVTFEGYFIPRRTLIVANLYSSNMDPRHWNRPEIFNPERFIEDGKLKKNPALIPFSIGPRICLGESLAKMEMFLIFRNLLQRFTFCREDDNVKHSFETILDQNTRAPKPYKTRAVKRA
ncbi:cytochrome P450 2J4-like [Mercenaria mercenaria]|uniref:cytochrome P450 2J4-like n=1 Tax=Mercenaria mercenaria TaxID=6596 RepID=UPI00234F61FC|nr:cytochrome P450 2J4-like [Mercenaria mercenaria]